MHKHTRTIGWLFTLAIIGLVLYHALYQGADPMAGLNEAFAWADTLFEIAAAW